MASLEDKKHALEEMLRDMGSVLVAYSAGVDSTLLLKIAHDVLGNKAVALTASLPAARAVELEDASRFCEELKVEHIVYEFDQLAVEGFACNPENRCYLCKRALFAQIVAVAGNRGIPYVLDGTNTDDMREYRPGAQALVELGIKSPLRDAGFSKSDIRELSRQLGLPTWNKPSSPCLVTRLEHGQTITVEKLRAIDCAEQVLESMGVPGARVRVHGSMARIEAASQHFARIVEPAVSQKLTAKFHELGFTFVSLDLDGYRTGSMDKG